MKVDLYNVYFNKKGHLCKSKFEKEENVMFKGTEYKKAIRELNNKWLPYKNRNTLNKKHGNYINSVRFQMLDNTEYNESLKQYLNDNILNIPLNTFNKIRMLNTIKDEYIKNLSIKVLPKYILVDFLQIKGGF